MGTLEKFDELEQLKHLDEKGNGSNQGNENFFFLISQKILPDNFFLQLNHFHLSAFSRLI